MREEARDDHRLSLFQYKPWSMTRSYPSQEAGRRYVLFGSSVKCHADLKDQFNILLGFWERLKTMPDQSI